MSEEKIDGRDYDLVPTQDETTSGRQLPVPKYQQSPDVPKDFKALAEAIVDDLDEIAGNIGDIDINQDGSLQDQIKDLSEQVQQNTDNIGDNDKDTDGTLKEQIDALDGKVEDNTTNINNNTGQIDQNKQDIEDLQNLVGDGIEYTLEQEQNGIVLKDQNGDYSGIVRIKEGENIGIEYKLAEDEIIINADPGVPLGGLDGEVLTKLSDESGDYGWMPSTGSGGGCCAASYSEERDCAADACTDGGTPGGGGAACFNNYGEQKNCTPSGEIGGGGACYATWDEMVNCTPSGDNSGGEEYIVLLDGAVRPTKYVGKGRPDVDGVPGTPVAGDTYICTTPDADGNFGAREWRYNGTDWECTLGNTGWYNIPLNWGSVDGSGYQRVKRINSTVYYGLHRWSSGGKASDLTRPAVVKNLNLGWTLTETFPIAKVYSSDPARSYVGPEGTATALGTSVYLANAEGTGFEADFPVAAYCSGLVSSNPPNTNWPTEAPHSSATPVTFETEKARLTKAIKEIEDDPEHEHHEKLNELKAEIETIQEGTE